MEGSPIDSKEFTRGESDNKKHPVAKLLKKTWQHRSSFKRPNVANVYKVVLDPRVQARHDAYREKIERMIPPVYIAGNPLETLKNDGMAPSAFAR